MNDIKLAFSYCRFYVTSQWNAYWTLTLFTIFSFICIWPYYTLFILKWLFLGIISSIGFGSGIHTGILVLFPEIMREAAHNGPFWNGILTTIYSTWFQTFIWGIGTALGELPPFLLARHISHSLHGSDDDNHGDAGSGVGSGAGSGASGAGGSAGDTVIPTWMKNWVEKYRFWAILLFASYPNAMFDVCGFLAGHIGMPSINFY